MNKDGNKNEDKNIDNDGLDNGLDNDGFDENPFAVDFDSEEDDINEDWINSLDGVNIEENQDDSDDFDSEDDGSDDDGTIDKNIFDENDNSDDDGDGSDDDDDSDVDLEMFNKKLNKDFKSKKELFDYLNDKADDKGADKSKEEDVVLKSEKEITDLDGYLDYYNEKLDLNDDELMRSYFTEVAIADKKVG